MTAYNISFIGAGNVAVSLAPALASAGHTIISVSSKSGTSAAKLAETLGAEWRYDNTIADNCDLVIISVTDAAVTTVASSVVSPPQTVIVHTAGSVPLKALVRTNAAGVLYPLQTFSLENPPDISKIPFFIEASDNHALTIIREVAESVGATAIECDSEKRKMVHLAAVFINNFSNFMMTAGEDIINITGIEPAVLRPLMEETLRKIIRSGPEEAQTGPARRDDAGTIKSHLDSLSFSPQYRELYRLVSSMITGYYKKRKR